MKVFNTIEGLNVELDVLKNQAKTIGFVPTMGALHLGHLSLVNIARSQNDVVVVSIFVNPTQFNNPDDLRNYPRDLQSDLHLLKDSGCEIVFAPDEKEMYPDENSKKSIFEYGHLSKVMEGKFRPGHFDGVGIVVKRLFEIVRPDRAYFGQKDIQQFLIINHLNNNYLKDLNIELVKCPIIRENDGLAMSSRNVLLNTVQRKSSSLISQTLFDVTKIYKNHTPESLINVAINKINSDTNLKVEYFELVSDPDLKPVVKWESSTKILACVAVQVGKVRLIDNIYLIN
jgi:pantoate--beta-alanine ligase